MLNHVKYRGNKFKCGAHFLECGPVLMIDSEQMLCAATIVDTAKASRAGYRRAFAQIPSVRIPDLVMKRQ